MKTPHEIYGELFEAIQSGGIFSDSKTFVDAVPRREPGLILQDYRDERGLPGFDLKSFVVRNFELPETSAEAPASRVDIPLRERIDALWDTLTRQADVKETHSSLIELPFPYVVPGGRFRELYYWDSYFTMLGLAESGKVGMLQNMVANFAYLVDRVGFIPNGTRSYYCTRSQPPFFVLMVELLAEVLGDPAVRATYLPQLKMEYEFWMSGTDTLRGGHEAIRRVVAVDDTYLNRYWDDSDLPREESYAEDVALAANTGRTPEDLYRNIRAACESGWDFSSRWLADHKTMASICTTDVLPVDLNSLLYRLETVLADVSDGSGDRHAAQHYRGCAERRRDLLRSLFFDEHEGMFVDITGPDRRPTGALSLAAAYPLFFGIATEDQAARVSERLHRDFLKAGGWVTTLNRTGQQWDAPNGWAPAQWIVFDGLRNYGFHDAACEGAQRWIDNNVLMYRESGRLLEKYNVEQPGLIATGGEYRNQDGFGWTNAVLVKLMQAIAGYNR